MSPIEFGEVGFDSVAVLKFPNDRFFVVCCFDAICFLLFIYVVIARTALDFVLGCWCGSRLWVTVKHCASLPKHSTQKTLNDEQVLLTLQSGELTLVSVSLEKSFPTSTVDLFCIHILKCLGLWWCNKLNV
jgi:hypothetical protein